MHLLASIVPKVSGVLSEVQQTQTKTAQQGCQHTLLKTIFNPIMDARALRQGTVTHAMISRQLLRLLRATSDAAYQHYRCTPLPHQPHVARAGVLLR